VRCLDAPGDGALAATVSFFLGEQVEYVEAMRRPFSSMPRSTARTAE